MPPKGIAIKIQKPTNMQKTVETPAPAAPAVSAPAEPAPAAPAAPVSGVVKKKSTKSVPKNEESQSKPAPAAKKLNSLSVLGLHVQVSKCVKLVKDALNTKTKEALEQFSKDNADVLKKVRDLQLARNAATTPEAKAQATDVYNKYVKSDDVNNVLNDQKLLRKLVYKINYQGSATLAVVIDTFVDEVVSVCMSSEPEKLDLDTFMKNTDKITSSVIFPMFTRGLNSSNVDDVIAVSIFQSLVKNKFTKYKTKQNQKLSSNIRDHLSMMVNTFVSDMIHYISVLVGGVNIPKTITDTHILNVLNIIYYTKDGNVTKYNTLENIIKTKTGLYFAQVQSRNMEKKQNKTVVSHVDSVN